MTGHSFCTQCDDEHICPIGTKYQFPVDKFGDTFLDVKVENMPDSFDVHKLPFDNTATVVMFSCFACTLILCIIIAVILSM
jgi:hypothetical protein